MCAHFLAIITQFIADRGVKGGRRREYREPTIEKLPGGIRKWKRINYIQLARTRAIIASAMAGNSVSAFAVL